MASLNISAGFKAAGAGLFQIAGSRAQRTEKELQRLHDVHMQELREKSATKRQQESETRYQGRLKETRGYEQDLFAKRAGGTRSQKGFEDARKKFNALMEDPLARSDPKEFSEKVQTYLRTYADSPSTSNEHRKEIGRLAVNALNLIPADQLPDLPNMVRRINQRYDPDFDDYYPGTSTSTPASKPEEPGFFERAGSALSDLFTREEPYQRDPSVLHRSTQIERNRAKGFDPKKGPFSVPFNTYTPGLYDERK